MDLGAIQVNYLRVGTEKEVLQYKAGESLGIDLDGRWSVARMEREIYDDLADGFEWDA